MKAKSKIHTFNISKEKQKVIHDRVEEFMRKYYKAQSDKLNFNHNEFVQTFDIKNLCYSCYIQGLADGNEATIKQQKVVK